MHFVFIYKNRRMKLVEIVRGRGRGLKRENNAGVTLRYIVNIHVIITVDLL
jgi:hypothetical protein